MKYRVKDLRDAIKYDEFPELADEIDSRLCNLRALNIAVSDLLATIYDSELITVKPAVLFALAKLITLEEDIDIDC
jgi:hypothetical protein